jgi:hypothetical protein
VGASGNGAAPGHCVSSCPSQFPAPLLGPPIVRPDDILPAVLESMAVAITNNPQDALKPYQRLYGLGTDASSTAGLPRLVEDWLEQGTLPGQPPPATGDTAENRAERADALVEFLQMYLDHYDEIGRLDQRNGERDLPRVYELATEIHRELDLLKMQVAAARQVVTKKVIG